MTTGFKTLRVGMDVRQTKRFIQPKLLGRVVVTDAGPTGSTIVSATGQTRFVIIRAQGSGQLNNVRGGLGSGGDWVRSNLECLPSAQFNVRVSPAANKDAEVYMGLEPVLRAKGGGSLSTSFGDVIRPGATGSFSEGNTAIPGLPGNDLLDLDSLFMTSVAGYSTTNAVMVPNDGYGVGSAWAQSPTSILCAPTGGIVIIEFYTADPR